MAKDKQTKKKINWQRTWRNNVYMLRFITQVCPTLLVFSVIGAVIDALSSFLLGTYLYSYALSGLQAGRSVREILIGVGWMLAFAVACQIFFRLSSRYHMSHAPLVDAHIQRLLQKKAVEVELSCFERPDFYDTYIKATGETSDRAFTVLYHLSNLIYMVVYVGATVTLIFTISPIFLLLACLPLLATALIGRRRNRIRYDYNMRRKEIDRQKDYVRRTFYLADFAKEMRMGEMWQVMFRRMHDSVEEMKGVVRQYGYKNMFFRYLFDLLFDVVVHLSSILLAAYRTLVTKTMLLGDCFVIINSLVDLSYRLNYAGDTVLKLDENSLYIDNLRAFLEYEVQIPEAADAPAPDGFASLSLRDVRFTYEGQERPALDGISLTVRRGERIALVGHNGAGKSTLIKLLLRFYDPTEGAILVNGEDIRTYRLSAYRALYGTVFQDYRLFAATVAENVAGHGGLREGDRETVTAALDRAGMADKIASLPHGQDTNVTREFDKEGAQFSGGEAQKLAIARIFAASPEIVLLDEPTSALDPIAEQEMYRNMFEAAKGKTVIFISHRLSSAVTADRVYLFEQGHIIEQGSHRELLALGGKYADMWHKQADTYLDGEEAHA